MKNILIIALALFALLVPALSQPDPYYMMTGRQMTGTFSGATGYGPWFGDSTIVYWGTGKDVSMFYNQTSDTINVTGKTVIMPNGATISGTTMNNGTHANDVVITGSHTLTTGTGLVQLLGIVEDHAAVKAASTVQDNSLWVNTTSHLVGNVAAFGTLKTTGTSTVNALVSNGSISGTSAVLTTTTHATGNAEYFGTMNVGGALKGNTVASNGSVSGTSAVFTTTTHATGNAEYFGTMKVTGATTVASLAVNGTSTLTGVTSMVGPQKSTANTTTTNDTLTAATSPRIQVIGNSAGERITLPAVSGNSGLTYTFIIGTAASGSHDNIIDGASSENINGATTIGCATKYASITLYCTGTEWIATSIGQVGTWAADTHI